MVLNMNSFKKKYSFILLLFFFIKSGLVLADQCPSSEIIKERNISRDYEWTIDERRSLKDVLSVEKLYSVRIKNKGEFIACFYSGSKKLLRLDGASLTEKCVIRIQSGNWEQAENGEQVCKEDDLSLCLYEIHCEESDGNLMTE
jgi:hypothetical protein